MVRKLVTTLGAVLALGTATAATATDIDNTTGGVTNFFSQFGSPNAATYGQTFVPDRSRITSFSLFLHTRRSGAGPLDFKGYLGTWDGEKLGKVLYTSDIQTTNGGTLIEYSFDTGNTKVKPGDTYVAFLSISDLAAQPDSAFRFPIAVNDIAGNLVFRNSGTNFGSLTTSRWAAPEGNDTFFKASFNAVPEPANWALMIVGFGLVGATMRRRAIAGLHSA